LECGLRECPRPCSDRLRCDKQGSTGQFGALSMAREADFSGGPKRPDSRPTFADGPEHLRVAIGPLRETGRASSGEDALAIKPEPRQADVLASRLWCTKAPTSHRVRTWNGWRWVAVVELSTWAPTGSGSRAAAGRRRAVRSWRSGPLRQERTQPIEPIGAERTSE